jgi:purine nucleosidase
MTKKLLIDTDIGDDIDDALAIAYSLGCPELEVVGITTVFRNTRLRKQMVLQQLKQYCRTDIPVAAGVGSPLVVQADVNAIPTHYDPQVPTEIDNCDISAVELLIETAKVNPGMTILAIAPMTNLACALRMAPEIMRDIAVVSMAGMYSGHYPEWNVWCDPEAADIVLQGYRNLTMIGLDVTLSCRMSQAQVNAVSRREDGNSRFLSAWLKRWMDVSGHLPILHDPLAAVACAHPRVLTTEPMQIRVECAGNLSRGTTVRKIDPFWHRPQQPNVRVATGVDRANFMTLFLDGVFPGLDV